MAFCQAQTPMARPFKSHMGLHRIMGTLLGGVPIRRNIILLESILGSPHSGKLPCDSPRVLFWGLGLHILATSKNVPTRLPLGNK